jgi:hypothetical protein
MILAAVLSAAVLAAAVIGFAVLRRPAEARTAPALPAVDRFAPGPCRDVADAVLALARLTRTADVAALSTADRAELRRLQDRLVTAQPAASGEVRSALSEVVVSLGYLRIRLDSRTAGPEYLRQAEEARSRLEMRCVHTR